MGECKPLCYEGAPTLTVPFIFIHAALSACTGAELDIQSIPERSRGAHPPQMVLITDHFMRNSFEGWCFRGNVGLPRTGCTRKGTDARATLYKKTGQSVLCPLVRDYFDSFIFPRAAGSVCWEMERDAPRMLSHWQVFKEKTRVSLGLRNHPAFASSAYKSFRQTATNS